MEFKRIVAGICTVVLLCAQWQLPIFLLSLQVQAAEEKDSLDFEIFNKQIQKILQDSYSSPLFQSDFILGQKEKYRSVEGLEEVPQVNASTYNFDKAASAADNNSQFYKDFKTVEGLLDSYEKFYYKEVKQLLFKDFKKAFHDLRILRHSIQSLVKTEALLPSEYYYLMRRYQVIYESIKPSLARHHRNTHTLNSPESRRDEIAELASLWLDEFDYNDGIVHNPKKLFELRKVENRELSKEEIKALDLKTRTRMKLKVFYDKATAGDSVENLGMYQSTWDKNQKPIFQNRLAAERGHKKYEEQLLDHFKKKSEEADYAKNYRERVEELLIEFKRPSHEMTDIDRAAFSAKLKKTAQTATHKQKELNDFLKLPSTTAEQAKLALQNYEQQVLVPLSQLNTFAHLYGTHTVAVKVETTIGGTVGGAVRTTTATRHVGGNSQQMLENMQKVTIPSRFKLEDLESTDLSHQIQFTRKGNFNTDEEQARPNESLFRAFNLCENNGKISFCPTVAIGAASHKSLAPLQSEEIMAKNLKMALFQMNAWQQGLLGKMGGIDENLNVPQSCQSHNDLALPKELSYNVARNGDQVLRDQIVERYLNNFSKRERELYPTVATHGATAETGKDRYAKIIQSGYEGYYSGERNFLIANGNRLNSEESIFDDYHHFNLIQQHLLIEELKSNSTMQQAAPKVTQLIEQFIHIDAQNILTNTQGNVAIENNRYKDFYLSPLSTRTLLNYFPKFLANEILKQAIQIEAASEDDSWADFESFSMEAANLKAPQQPIDLYLEKGYRMSIFGSTDLAIEENIQTVLKGLIKKNNLSQRFQANRSAVEFPPIATSRRKKMTAIHALRNYLNSADPNDWSLLINFSNCAGIKNIINPNAAKALTCPADCLKFLKHHLDSFTMSSGESLFSIERLEVGDPAAIKAYAYLDDVWNLLQTHELHSQDIVKFTGHEDGSSSAAYDPKKLSNAKLNQSIYTYITNNWRTNLWSNLQLGAAIYEENKSQFIKDPADQKLMEEIANTSHFYSPDSTAIFNIPNSGDYTFNLFHNSTRNLGKKYAANELHMQRYRKVDYPKLQRELKKWENSFHLIYSKPFRTALVERELKNAEPTDVPILDSLYSHLSKTVDALGKDEEVRFFGQRINYKVTPQNPLQSGLPGEFYKREASLYELIDSIHRGTNFGNEETLDDVVSSVRSHPSHSKRLAAELADDKKLLQAQYSSIIENYAPFKHYVKLLKKGENEKAAELGGKIVNNISISELQKKVAAGEVSLEQLDDPEFRQQHYDSIQATTAARIEMFTHDKAKLSYNHVIKSKASQMYESRKGLLTDLCDKYDVNDRHNIRDMIMLSLDNLEELVNFMGYENVDMDFLRSIRKEISETDEIMKWYTIMAVNLGAFMLLAFPPTSAIGAVAMVGAIGIDSYDLYHTYSDHLKRNENQASIEKAYLDGRITDEDFQTYLTENNLPVMRLAMTGGMMLTWFNPTRLLGRMGVNATKSIAMRSTPITGMKHLREIWREEVHNKALMDFYATKFRVPKNSSHRELINSFSQVDDIAKRKGLTTPEEIAREYDDLAEAFNREVFAKEFVEIFGRNSVTRQTPLGVRLPSRTTPHEIVERIIKDYDEYFDPHMAKTLFTSHFDKISEQAFRLRKTSLDYAELTELATKYGISDTKFVTDLFDVSRRALSSGQKPSPNLLHGLLNKHSVNLEDVSVHLPALRRVWGHSRVPGFGGYVKGYEKRLSELHEQFIGGLRTLSKDPNLSPDKLQDFIADHADIIINNGIQPFKKRQVPMMFVQGSPFNTKIFDMVDLINFAKMVNRRSAKGALTSMMRKRLGADSVEAVLDTADLSRSPNARFNELYHYLGNRLLADPSLDPAVRNSAALMVEKMHNVAVEAVQTTLKKSGHNFTDAEVRKLILLSLPDKGLMTDAAWAKHLKNKATVLEAYYNSTKPVYAKFMKSQTFKVQEEQAIRTMDDLDVVVYGLKASDDSTQKTIFSNLNSYTGRARNTPSAKYAKVKAQNIYEGLTGKEITDTQVLRVLQALQETKDSIDLQIY